MSNMILAANGLENNKDLITYDNVDAAGMANLEL